MSDLKTIYFILAILISSTCMVLSTDKLERADKSKKEDSDNKYPLLIRLETTGEHFWQNIGNDSAGTPFYFSGPHYTKINKFEWKKNTDNTITNIKLVLLDGEEEVKNFDLNEAEGGNWSDTGFTGKLQEEVDNNLNYLDPSAHGQKEFVAKITAEIDGKKVESKEIEFDVRSRIIFWYDPTVEGCDNGAPSAINQAEGLGKTSDNANSSAEVLICTGEWKTAWEYQTVRGEMYSTDHGDIYFDDENSDGIFQRDDPATKLANDGESCTYASINIGGGDEIYSGFNENGIGVGRPTYDQLEPLYLPHIKVYLQHCYSGAHSCGENELHWVEPFDLDNQNSLRIIDTLTDISDNIGSGTVYGYSKMFTLNFDPGYLYNTRKINLTDPQNDTLSAYIGNLIPTTYHQYSENHEGTVEGWSQYLSLIGLTLSDQESPELFGMSLPTLQPLLPGHFRFPGS